MKAPRPWRAIAWRVPPYGGGLRLGRAPQRQRQPTFHLARADKRQPFRLAGRRDARLPARWQAGEYDGSVRREVAGDVVGDRAISGPARMLAMMRSNGRMRGEDRIAEASAVLRLDQLSRRRSAQRFPRDAASRRHRCRSRAPSRRPWRWRWRARRCRCRDRGCAGSRAPSRAGRSRSGSSARRAVMAGAEGLAGLDLDRDVAGLHLVAVWLPRTRKRPARTGFSSFERFRHPVLVGKRGSHGIGPAGPAP